MENIDTEVPNTELVSNSDVINSSKYSTPVKVIFSIIGVAIIALITLLLINRPTQPAISFSTYTDEYYSFEYPQSWQVYQVEGSDNALRSILILPKEVAMVYELSATTSLGVTQAYRLIEKLDKEQNSYITLGGIFSYDLPIPASEHKTYLEKNKGTDGSVIEVGGQPRLITKEVTSNDVLSESSIWFAKPDEFERDKFIGLVLVSLKYVANKNKYNQEISERLANSVNDTIFASYLKNEPIPKDIPTNGQVTFDTIYTSTTSTITGIALPRDGTNFVMGISNDNYDGEDFSTILQFVNGQDYQLKKLNLLPFKSQLELNVADYKDQQVFSPSGEKMLLTVDVGIKSENNEDIAGFTGFAVYDLPLNKLITLIDTDTYKYQQIFSDGDSLGGPYPNTYGWLSENEIAYTCNTDSSKRIISLSEVDYCAINIDTKKIRVIKDWEVLFTSFGSDVLDAEGTIFFTSHGPECTNLLAVNCLRINNGVITLERGDKVYTVKKGEFNTFYGWTGENGIYLVLNQYTRDGSISELIKFDLITN